MVLIRQFPVPTEGIKFQSAAVEAYVDNDAHGKGILFITEANIAWICSNSGEGFKIAYKKMTLHAISRDPGVHSTACLYIMINGNSLDEDDENFEVECPEEVEEGEEEMTEIRFVPEDSSILDTLYKAVQDCSLLHPDPSSDLSNDEDDPDERFEGYAGLDEIDENVNDEQDEELDGEEEAERLEQFVRMQLHFGSSRNGNNENNDGTNGGDPGLSFVPEPGQFDDE